MTNDLETRIKTWADKQWPNRTLASRLRKLGEEVGELAEAVVVLEVSGESRHAAACEAADCAIVLSDICSLLGYSLTGVMAEKVEQLETVGSRTSGVERRFMVPPADLEGVAFHSGDYTAEELKAAITSGPVCHSSAERYYNLLKPKGWKCEHVDGTYRRDNTMTYHCRRCGDQVHGPTVAGQPALVAR